jgi:hypothetical protein
MANIAASPNAPQATVSDPVATALSALQSGTDIDTAVYGESSAPAKTPKAAMPKESEEQTEEQQSLEAAEQDTPPEEQTESTEEEAANAAPSDVEELELKDASGRKTKVAIDWSDRDSIKKYIHQAAGMRYFQAERDKVQKELTELKTSSEKLSGTWNKLEQAFDKNGIDGVIELIAGGPQKAQEFLAAKFDRMQARATATPFELERMDLEEQLKSERKERELMQRQVQEQLKRAESEREATEVKQLENKIHPAFNKYRFAGQLGDAEVEASYDKAVWNQTMERLEAKGEALTQEMIDSEFKTVAMAFRKVISQQANQKATKVLANKKAAVSEAIATKATKGYAPKDAPEKEAFKKDISSGNLVGALTGLLTGKMKM